MLFAISQNPRAILPSVFPANPGVVVFNSAVYIVGLPDIKFAVFPALEDIDVIYNYFFGIPH